MVEDRSPDIRLVPVTFRDACEFVQAWHRHHRPPVGHKFSVGVACYCFFGIGGSTAHVGQLSLGAWVDDLLHFIYPISR